MLIQMLLKEEKLYLAQLDLMILLILLFLKEQPAAGIGNLYETLTTSSSDEAFTEYGLMQNQLNGQMIVLGLLLLFVMKQYGMMEKKLLLKM